MNAYMKTIPFIKWPAPSSLNNPSPPNIILVSVFFHALILHILTFHFNNSFLKTMPTLNDGFSLLDLEERATTQIPSKIFFLRMAPYVNGWNWNLYPSILFIFYFYFPIHIFNLRIQLWKGYVPSDFVFLYNVPLFS